MNKKINFKLINMQYFNFTNKIYFNPYLDVVYSDKLFYSIKTVKNFYYILSLLF